MPSGHLRDAAAAGRARAREAMKSRRVIRGISDFGCRVSCARIRNVRPSASHPKSDIRNPTSFFLLRSGGHLLQLDQLLFRVLGVLTLRQESEVLLDVLGGAGEILFLR